VKLNQSLHSIQNARGQDDAETFADFIEVDGTVDVNGNNGECD
jgi:hypothetical protein